jgi:hypothetical protein
MKKVIFGLLLLVAVAVSINATSHKVSTEITVVNNSAVVNEVIFELSKMPAPPQTHMYTCLKESKTFTAEVLTKFQAKARLKYNDYYANVGNPASVARTLYAKKILEGNPLAVAKAINYVMNDTHVTNLSDFDALTDEAANAFEIEFDKLAQAF